VIDHNGAWLPTMTIGLPLAILLMLAGVIAVVACFITADDLADVGVIIGIGTLIFAAFMGFGYWPFMGDYHRLQPATGTVKVVDTRFLAASSYVVVTYDTGLMVRCDDSRCATVREGETLKLLCTKEHQFGSPYAADGWACRWGDERKS